jgi:hypothetical protein
MWKIVIQDNHSFCYLHEEGVWCPDALRARAFTRIIEAAEHCAAAGLKDVYIIMGMLQPDGRFDSNTKTIMRVPAVHGSSSVTVPAEDEVAR